jgi:hypothetical protein
VTIAKKFIGVQRNSCFHNSIIMTVSRSRIFSLRGLTLFVFFLLAVLASAQEDVPTLEDPEASAEEAEEAEEEGEEGDEEAAVDEHEECPEWAFEGECGENTEFMWAECELSCENHEQCDGWAEDDQCAENTEFMMENCPWYCDDEQEEEL